MPTLVIQTNGEVLLSKQVQMRSETGDNVKKALLCSCIECAGQAAIWRPGPRAERQCAEGDAPRGLKDGGQRARQARGLRADRAAL